MGRLRSSSTQYLDMIVSQLRSQIVTMHNILELIERTHSYEDDYIISSIKMVEIELRRLRSFINS